MPAEPEVRLKHNKQARAFFDSLSPLCRRRCVDRVASAKRETTKQRRIHEAIDLLESGKKPGMRQAFVRRPFS